LSNSPTIPVDLKPLSLSELLDQTFTLYRNHFWLFCGLMAIPQVVIAGVSIIIYINPATRTLPAMQPNPQNPFAALEAMVPIVLAALLILILSTLVFSIAVSAVTFAVSKIRMGQPASIRKSYAMLVPRIVGLLGLIVLLIFIGCVFVFAGLLAGGFIGGLLGGLLAFVSPILTGIVVFLMLFAGLAFGLWLLMRFSVSIPVYLLERRGALDSLARSGVLTKGHRWRIFVATVVVTLIVYVVHLLFQLPFSISGLFNNAMRGVVPLWQQIGATIASAISGTLAGSLITITIVLIYYDTRIRKEAFDLEAMMAALGPSTGTPGGPSTAPPPPAQPI